MISWSNFDKLNGYQLSDESPNFPTTSLIGGGGGELSVFKRKIISHEPQNWSKVKNKLRLNFCKMQF